ncbi:MAG TPA: F0F1 ATP synthase subunit B [Ignavibacteria bacterium]
MTGILSFVGHNLVFLFSGSEGHKEFGLLTVNPGLIIWTIIIFILVLLVLRKYAWKPLLKALNNREDTIKNALDNAERLNKEAKELMEQNKKNLDEATKQSMEIINEAKEMAKKEKDGIISKAGEEANKLIVRAKQDIENEKESAIEQMRDQISDLVIKAAGKIINENLDEPKQKKIIDDFLTRVSKN